MYPQGSLTLDGRYMQRKIDYWVAGTNENAEYYSPGSNGEAADTYSSSMGYQDGSYIKVRNISLGYNFTTKTAEEHRTQQFEGICTGHESILHLQGLRLAGYRFNEL